MKKNSTLLTFIAVAMVFSFKTYATIHTISVGNGTFTPNSVSAFTGDTIHWVWQNGNHDTKCDGTGSTVLPAGALSWYGPLASAGATFDYVPVVAGNYTYECSIHGFIGTLIVSLNTGIATVTPPSKHLDVLTSDFNANAEIKFYIPLDGKVNVSIYDLTGKKVVTVLDKELARGEYSNIWETNSVPYGTYLCRLESKEFISTKKFVLRK